MIPGLSKDPFEMRIKSIQSALNSLCCSKPDEPQDENESLLKAIRILQNLDEGTSTNQQPFNPYATSNKVAMVTCTQAQNHFLNMIPLKVLKHESLRTNYDFEIMCYDRMQTKLYTFHLWNKIVEKVLGMNKSTSKGKRLETGAVHVDRRDAYAIFGNIARREFGMITSSVSGRIPPWLAFQRVVERCMREDYRKLSITNSLGEADPWKGFFANQQLKVGLYGRLERQPSLASLRNTFAIENRKTKHERLHQDASITDQSLANKRGLESEAGANAEADESSENVAVKLFIPTMPLNTTSNQMHTILSKPLDHATIPSIPTGGPSMKEPRRGNLRLLHHKNFSPSRISSTQIRYSPDGRPSTLNKFFYLPKITPKVNNTRKPGNEFDNMLTYLLR
ncbi:hypothetical protein DdX_07231 [Ditylenchus destructor]|uniref:Uncharacterized protein n=1 Tax=Ditylenchus destructor TaxID=166010 RepID=A0AAD4N9G8_9BILA|nr:hypothetical protein DdX_07231 [Ditylenchus destructor]